MLDTLRLEDFETRLNQSFRLRGDSGDLQLELIEASAIGSADQPSDGKRAPFSLLFRGPGDVPMAQRMYDVEHQAMGRLSLFIVPIGPDDRGMLYEVIFN